MVRVELCGDHIWIGIPVDFLEGDSMGCFEKCSEFQFSEQDENNVYSLGPDLVLVALDLDRIKAV